MHILHVPMKYAATMFAGTLLVFVAGCSKQERAEAGTKARDAFAETSEKAREMYADSRAAVSSAWESVKSHTFEKRDEFTASARTLSEKMEAQTARLRAEYSDAKASARRKAAMAEVKYSEINYREKLDALGEATAATWESAKSNVIAAWERLEAAVREAREEKPE